MSASEKCTEFLIQYTTLPQKTTKKEIITKYQKYSSIFCDELKATRYKYNVICHGDLWANNLMFKYDGEQVVDCCLVDFQILRFLPPTQDVLLFLYINTLHPFREKHLQDLLDHYYHQLSNELNLYGLSSGVVYPKHEYVQSCKDRLLSVLNISVTYKTLMSLDRAEMNKIMGDKEINYMAIFKDRVTLLKPIIERDEVYRNKILGELQEMIDAL